MKNKTQRTHNVHSRFTRRLALTPLAIAITFTVNAADDIQATPLSDIEVLEVTATRIGSQPSLANSVSISQEDIALLQPKSVVELLSFVAGLDVSQQGARGQNASVFMRGTNSNHTLVIIDGVRVGSATLGSTNLHNISPNQIERIEILKGPRAAIWGSDAIGGVIHIFTKRLNGLSAELTVGSENYRQSQLGLGGNYNSLIGDGSFSVNVSKEQADGFDVLQSAEPDNDGFAHTSLSIRGEHQIHSDWTVDYMMQSLDGNNEYDNAYGGNNETDVNNQAWLIGLTRRGESSVTRVSTRSSVNETRDYNEQAPDFGVTEFETERQQLSAIHNQSLAGNVTLTLGFDLLSEHVSGTTQYEITRRDIASVFGHALYQPGKLTLEAAWRYDDVEHLTSQNTFNLAVGYQVTNQSQLSVNYGTGFKAPTFNDLYYPSGPYSAGNPLLTSETSTTTELLYRSRWQALRYQFSAYQTDVEDLIVWQADQNFLYRPVNIDSVSIKGLELDINYDSDWGAHSLNASFIEAIDDATNQQLIRRAKQHVNYSFTEQLADLSLAIQVQYKGKRNDAYYDSTVFATVETELNSYYLVNASLSYPLSNQWQIRLKVNNLLDESYTTAYGYQTQGAVVYFGVQYQ